MSKTVNSLITLIVFGFTITPSSAQAQNPAPESDIPAHVPTLKAASEIHKFWDGQNLVLFSGVAITRTLDFTSTQHFRERGVNEVLLTNKIVDDKALFAGIEVAGTAASVGIAYWLHRTRHHRAERWVSIVHIGVGTFGDIRNYGLSRPNGQTTVR